MKGISGKGRFECEKHGSYYQIFEATGVSRKLIFQSKSYKEYEIEINKLRNDRQKNA